MKSKFEVRWEETRRIKCYAEVEADSKEEAIKLAQNYETDVDECESYTEEMFPGHAETLEEE